MLVWPSVFYKFADILPEKYDTSEKLRSYAQHTTSAFIMHIPQRLLIYGVDTTEHSTM